jgi:hypothetical protein
MEERQTSMADHFHYPPEVFSLLVDTIPLLCRSKKDVLLFFQGAGVSPEDLADVSRTVRTNAPSISKYEIARTVLTKMNARGDSGLRSRRELLKRVTEFEDYSSCWPSDQLKARGLVATLRSIVNVKDSFTRMKQERDAEREEIQARVRAEQTAAAEKRTRIQGVSSRLAALFGMDDEPHERGKLLEVVLNDLFSAYGVLIREDFRRKDPDSSIVLEQVDGVIELTGSIHLVEMKWLRDPVGVAEFGPHLVRIFGRAGASGIFISNSNYTEPVIKQCAEFLNQRITFLCSLHEIVMLLQRQDDLVAFLKRKSHAAIIDKKPYLEILG